MRYISLDRDSVVNSVIGPKIYAASYSFIKLTALILKQGHGLSSALRGAMRGTSTNLAKSLVIKTTGSYLNSEKSLSSSVMSSNNNGSSAFAVDRKDFTIVETMKTTVIHGSNASISATVKLLEGCCSVLTPISEMDSSGRFSGKDTYGLSIRLCALH